MLVRGELELASVLISGSQVGAAAGRGMGHGTPAVRRARGDEDFDTHHALHLSAPTPLSVNLTRHHPPHDRRACCSAWRRWWPQGIGLARAGWWRRWDPDALCHRHHHHQNRHHYHRHHHRHRHQQHQRWGRCHRNRCLRCGRALVPGWRLPSTSAGLPWTRLNSGIVCRWSYCLPHPILQRTLHLTHQPLPLRPTPMPPPRSKARRTPSKRKQTTPRALLTLSTPAPPFQMLHPQRQPPPIPSQRRQNRHRRQRPRRSHLKLW